MLLSEFFGYKFKDTEDRLDQFALFDARGNIIYWELSDGYWQERKFDLKNRVIEKNCSDGYWWKSEYDSDGVENCTAFGYDFCVKENDHERTAE